MKRILCLIYAKKRYVCEGEILSVCPCFTSETTVQIFIKFAAEVSALKPSGKFHSGPYILKATASDKFWHM
jgi:hypothetical protein